ncbi:hypothetical protein BD309DRAFT_1004094 [Dichomitus squalens]|nr:hypothetical protein BD309DRAFT_1004094 [Dichomitus squalens]
MVPVSLSPDADTSRDKSLGHPPYLKRLASIHDLPNELLSEIFALAASQPFDTQFWGPESSKVSLIVVDNLVPISATCRAWRTLVSETPFLWSSFFLDENWNENEGALVLQRSRDVPATLYYSGGIQETLCYFLGVLRHRLRELYILDETLEWDSVASMLSTDFPMLSACTLHLGDRADETRPSRNTYLSGSLQRLCCLRLSCPVILPSGHIPHLTNLQVDGGGPHTLSSVFALLSAAPRLEYLWLVLSVERDRDQYAGIMVRLQHLKRCSLNMEPYDDFLSGLTLPPNCLVLFKDLLDFELGLEPEELPLIPTLVAALPRHPFTQCLSRLRIVPDNVGFGSTPDPEYAYHVQLANETSTSGLHFQILRGDLSGPILQPVERGKMSRTMAEEIFSAYPSGSLVANVKELWVYKWTDWLTADVLARLPLLETLVLVLDGDPWNTKWNDDPPTTIPKALTKQPKAGQAPLCPALTNLCLIMCYDHAVQETKRFVKARKRAGHPIKRLALECVNAYALEYATNGKLAKLVNELVVSSTGDNYKYWAPHTFEEGWARGLGGWPEWPEWLEWRKLNSDIMQGLDEIEDE